MTAITLNRRFSTAPMMRFSHTHARHLWRLLCPQSLLYTEMIMAEAIVRNKSGQYIRFSPPQHPVALQIGGNDPLSLANAAKIGEQMGFDEININCGCPSPRVQNGQFGAVLMTTPSLVGDIINRIKNTVSIPVTVKCRLAVDDMDEKTDLDIFTATVQKAGVDALIVHARRAWLKGLNPSQNRSVPPLNYHRVKQLQQSFPTLPIVLNGGLESVDDICLYANQFSGVMVGRAICRRPYLLTELNSTLFNASPICLQPVLLTYLQYVRGLPLSQWHRALTTVGALFHGMPNRKSLHRQLLITSFDELNQLEYTLQNHEQWV